MQGPSLIEQCHHALPAPRVQSYRNSKARTNPRARYELFSAAGFSSSGFAGFSFMGTVEALWDGSEEEDGWRACDFSIASCWRVGWKV